MQFSIPLRCPHREVPSSRSALGLRPLSLQPALPQRLRGTPALFCTNYLNPFVLGCKHMVSTTIYLFSMGSVMIAAIARSLSSFFVPGPAIGCTEKLPTPGRQLCRNNSTPSFELLSSKTKARPSQIMTHPISSPSLLQRCHPIPHHQQELALLDPQ